MYILDLLKYRLNWPYGARSGFEQALSEVYQNVFYHSSSWGIIGAQAFRNEIQISCMDIGDGIRKTLEERWRYKLEMQGKKWDDLTAVEHALQYGISRLKGSPGAGLFNVRKYVRDFNGHLMLRSGMGEHITEGMKRVRKRNVIFFPGTQVVIKIPVVKW